MSHRKTTEEFIKQAKGIHGERYDYHKIDYYSNHKNVVIICRQHGEFPQTPSNHLGGAGCPKCGKEAMARIKSHSTDSFIKKSIEIHGNRYDYSLVQYANNNQVKVSIVCKSHGVFRQAPLNHLTGQGCPECAYDVLRNKFSSDLNEFILKSKQVHGDKYDYSESTYINSKTKIRITCPIHGGFFQEPSAHLAGQGCPRCGGTEKLTTEIFIERARKIHNNKYDYSLVDYVATDIPVKIICPIHGLFSQPPITHLYRGSGCHTCQMPLGERVIIGVLTSLGIQFEYQKRFNDCRNKQPLPFDFYIEQAKILIEYDGPQHFFPLRSAWSNLDKVKRTQYHDSLKTAYAASNGFHLIRIPYTQFDNIETILKAEIEKHI